MHTHHAWCARFRPKKLGKSLVAVSSQLVGLDPPWTRLASPIWCFFLSPFLTFRGPQCNETMHALIFWNVLVDLILLFSRNDVAKEFEILRKWTKKMSKTQTRRNTFVQKTRGLYNKWAEGLKERDPRIRAFLCVHMYNIIIPAGWHQGKKKKCQIKKKNMRG
jgi:hypothetical protein